jgi:pimeloyl-ACP methyl ester carboxylesterase
MAHALFSWTTLAVAKVALLFSLAGPVLAEPLEEQFRGLRLNAELRLAPGRSLEDGVVLMLPSPLGHHRMELIVNVQDVLAEKGISTLAPSLSLGYDDRRWYLDCDREIRFTVEGIFDEIDFWIGWLKRSGARHVTLFAHSLSANYATLYLVRRQAAASAVDGLVLFAPATLAYGEQGVQRYESRFKVSLRDVLARADRHIAEGRGEEAMAEPTDFYFCPAAKVTANAFVSLYRDVGSQDFPRLWRTLAVPSLMVIGTGDQRSPQIEAEAKRASEGGEIRVITIENGGHFFRGLYTDEAVTAMVDFINEIR